MVKVKKNLIGYKFNKLTVLKQVDDYIDSTNHHTAMFECQCECGNIITVRYGAIVSQTIKSCGCYRPLKNNPKMGLRKNNKYDLSGDYGIGYTRKNEVFYFDIEDYDKIKNYCWHYNPHGYLCAKDRNTHKNVQFHKLIMGDIPQGYIVDHKIHPHGRENKSDNRKSNLEIKTVSQNAMNIKQYSTTSSHCKGVQYDKVQKKWQARIGINKKRIHLGWFKTEAEAIKARKEAETKYYGKYSYDAITGG